VAVTKVQEPCRNNQALYFIIKECRELLFNKTWETNIKHCFREANHVTDHLANLGVEQALPLAVFDIPNHNCHGIQ